MDDYLDYFDGSGDGSSLDSALGGLNETLTQLSGIASSYNGLASSYAPAPVQSTVAGINTKTLLIGAAVLVAAILLLK